MVPALEEMGIRILLNECEVNLARRRSDLLVGIDDAHYYRVDNIEKGSGRNSRRRVSILLSHTLRFTAGLHIPALICF